MSERPGTMPTDRPVAEVAEDGAFRPSDHMPVTSQVAGQPSRRATIIRTGFIVVVLLVVFGVILPRAVDYEAIVAAFQSLAAWQIVILTLLGIAAWFVAGAVWSALVPGLSGGRGMTAFLILSGMGSSIPMGPWNLGVVWVVFRGWGISNTASASGIALYGVVDQLSRLILPLPAIVVIAMSGQLPGGSATRAWTVAVIGVVAFFVATGLIMAIVRSERVAHAIGHTVQRVVDWVLRRLGRTEGPDVLGAVLRFRLQLGSVIRERGLLAMAVGIASKLAWCVVLIAALRAVGVPESVLSNGAILAVFALVWIITILPIAPGGAGVPELLFIAGFTAIAGDQYADAISAGVFLYRIYQWFLPIPIAWILLKVVRRGRPILPTAAELKAVASGATVA